MSDIRKTAPASSSFFCSGWLGTLYRLLILRRLENTPIQSCARHNMPQSLPGAKNSKNATGDRRYGMVCSDGHENGRKRDGRCRSGQAAGVCVHGNCRQGPFSPHTWYVGSGGAGCCGGMCTRKLPPGAVFAAHMVCGQQAKATGRLSTPRCSGRGRGRGRIRRRRSGCRGQSDR